jgi:hypothetical protein
MTATIHPFDEAIRLEPLGDGAFAGHSSPAYWNMVGPYGGITAAQMLHAMLSRPERLGDPVSLTVNFAGPVAEGPLRIGTQLMRSNRSTQHWTATLLQDGGEPEGNAESVAATAMAVFGTRRPVWSHTEARPPTIAPFETLPRLSRPEAPAFTRRYDLRFERSPFESLSTDSRSACWVADHPPRPLDFPALASACDVFFPRIFLRRGKLVPVGTVSLNIYFHADGAALAEQGASPMLGAALCHVYQSGYFDQHGELWGRGDRLLATTHQIVWYRE